MSDNSHGPWAPGRGKTVEEAAEHAWENAKSGKPAPGLAAEHAQAGTYKLEIWIETTNPIHSYIVTINPTGP
jgi:hypothetical protein